MPRGCKWHYVGEYFTDVAPGLSEQWSLYVARDRAGCFYLKFDSDEVEIESFDSPTALVGFASDYGEAALDDLRGAIDGVPGFSVAARMIEFRTGRVSSG